MRSTSVTAAGASHRRSSKIPSSRPGRVCADLECRTVLSIYNAQSFCFLHEMPAVKPGRVLRG